MNFLTLSKLKIKALLCETFEYTHSYEYAFSKGANVNGLSTPFIVTRKSLNEHQWVKLNMQQMCTLLASCGNLWQRLLSVYAIILCTFKCHK